MPTIIACDACAAKLRARDGVAAVKCPKCKKVIRVAVAAQPAPAAVKVVGAVAAPAKPPGVPAPPAKSAAAATKAVSPPAKKSPLPAKSLVEAASGKELAKKQSLPAESTQKKAKPPRSLDDMFEAEAVPQRFQEVLRNELAHDEKVVWLGRPLMELRLRQATFAVIAGIVLFLVSLGLLGAGIVIGNVIMIVVGGVLFPISVLCLLARYLTKRFAGSREVYLITTRRVIMYPPVRSYNRRQLHNKLELRESSLVEGAGSLIFEIHIEYLAKLGGGGPMGGPRRMGRRMGGGMADSGVEKQVTEYGFKDIANVADIEKLIRNTILRGNVPPAEELDQDTGDHNQESGGVECASASRASVPPHSGRPKKVSRESVDAGRALIEDFDISDKVKTRALRRLDDDEKVIWVGKPVQKLVLVRSLGPALAALAAAVFTAVMAFQDLENTGTRLLPVSGVSLATAVGVPIVRRLRAARTLYVLTRRRATVWEPNLLGIMTVCDYTPDVLSRMFRRQSWFVKGAGDLVFRSLTKITTTHTYDRRGGYRGSRTSIVKYYWGFMAIDNVTEVEKLINDQVVEPFLDRVHDS